VDGDEKRPSPEPPVEEEIRVYTLRSGESRMILGWIWDELELDEDEELEDDWEELDEELEDEDEEELEELLEDEDDGGPDRDDRVFDRVIWGDFATDKMGGRPSETKVSLRNVVFERFRTPCWVCFKDKKVVLKLNSRTSESSLLLPTTIFRFDTMLIWIAIGTIFITEVLKRTSFSYVKADTEDSKFKTIFTIPKVVLTG
jgi:hypothetical protein